MSAALELVQTVEANGGKIHIEDGCLVIAPGEAAAPVMEELRQHKPEIIRLLRARSVSPHRPTEWREPLARWLDSECVRHPRAFGGVAALHRSYSDWEIAQHGVPSDLEVFERLLEELGFLMGVVEGTMLVSGLTFRDDVEAVGL